MTLELHALPTRSTAFAIGDSLLTSDRTTVGGTGYETVTDVRNMMGLGIAAAVAFASLTVTDLIASIKDVNGIFAGASVENVNAGTGAAAVYGITSNAGTAYFGKASSAFTTVPGATGKFFAYDATGIILTGSRTTVDSLTAGTDPGGIELVRIGGSVRANGSIFAMAVIYASAAAGAVELVGQSGSPSYIRVDQSANTGKIWRIGQSGASAYTTCDIYNQSDNILALSCKSDGSTVFGTDPGGLNTVRIGGALTINSATLISTKTTFTNGAAAAVGTLTNAPSAGNPAKWVPFDDNGTTLYFPAWA